MHFAGLLTESGLIIICTVPLGFPIDFLVDPSIGKRCENETLLLFAENSPLTDWSRVLFCI